MNRREWIKNTSLVSGAIILSDLMFDGCSEHKDATWLVAARNGTFMDFVCLDDAAGNELVTNAIDWINIYVRQQTNREIAVHSAKKKLVAFYVGFGEEARKNLTDFQINDDPGSQGFVLKQVNIDGKKAMCCWSPTELGCRYGLIEFLRSLKTMDGDVVSDILHVVDAPRFPFRIHYVNSAEHLQNAYNPNFLFDVTDNRWSLDDWERYIDMISAYRYNYFEFWLPPSLFGRNNEKLSAEFVQTINHVIAYAKRRGVSVHPLVTINTFVAPDGEWSYACPNDPDEKKRILDGWDFWTKSIQGNDSWCIFPGDPGGCFRNGCTKETYIDLALELSTVIRKNNPKASVEVGTWGEPIFGWGIPCPPWWTRDSKLVGRSMEYLIRKLPEFPQGTFVSINREFSPDADSDIQSWAVGGGDGRPYARKAAELVPVLTWDFGVPEGENSVMPRCRVRRMIETRKKEQEVGCYSGGIIFTMAPQLQCLSAFCGGETWWNPDRNPEEILDDYGRWTFGESNEKIGRLLEEFEVIPDWGFVPPFPYSADRLRDSMNNLLHELGQLDVKHLPRLPLSADYASHVKALDYFATLFRDLAELSLQVDALNSAYQKTSLAGETKEKVSLADVQRILTAKPDFNGRGDLEAAAKKLADFDVKGMKTRYWNTVYGIYDHIPTPPEERKPHIIENVFDRRFHASLAEPTINH